MSKTVLLLILLILAGNLFLSAKEEISPKAIYQLPEITRPSHIEVDKDGIFIVNNKFNIQIYSLKECKLIKKFGQKGEGPGEFKFSSHLFLRPEYIFIDSQNRISWFTKEGVFIKHQNKRIASTYIPFNNRFIVESVSFPTRQAMETEAAIHDSELMKIKKLEDKPTKIPIPLIVPGVPTKEWPMVKPYYGLGYDLKSGKIFMFDSQKGFFIKVFDESGNHLYSINKGKEIAKVAVSDKYKNQKSKEFKESSFWQELQKPKLIFPKYFPAYRWAKVVEGKIYIQTYKRKDNQNQFIVLDLKGKKEQDVYFPIKDHRYQTIYKNRLYKLMEDEEKETWQLFIYEFR